MYLKTRVFLLLLSLLYVVSCGQKNHSPSGGLSADGGNGFFKSEGVNLICGQQICSERVLSLFGNHSSRPSRCSAYILDNDRVLTASHCLPHALKTGDSCHQILFRSMNNSFKCNSVVAKVNLEGLPKGSITSDWAILDIETPELWSSTSQFSLGQFEFLEDLPNFQINDLIDIYWFKSDGVGLEFHQSECRVLMNNPFTNEVQSNSQQGLFVGPCDTVPGSSGGVAIHRSTGRIIGVLSQSSNDNDWAYISFVSGN